MPLFVIKGLNYSFNEWFAIDRQTLKVSGLYIVLCSGVKVGTDKLVRVRRFRAKDIHFKLLHLILHEIFLLLVRSWGETNKTI